MQEANNTIEIDFIGEKLLEHPASGAFSRYGRISFTHVEITDLEHMIDIQKVYELYTRDEIYTCAVTIDEARSEKTTIFNNIRINITYKCNGNEYIITLNIDSGILPKGETRVQFKYNTTTKEAKFNGIKEDGTGENCPFWSIKIDGVRWESDFPTYTTKSTNKPSIKRNPEYKESYNSKKLAKREEKEEKEEREDSLVLDKTCDIPKRRKSKRTLVQEPCAVMDTSMDFSEELAVDQKSTCIVYDRNEGTLRKYGGVFSANALTGRRMQCNEILIIGSRYDEKLKGDRIVRYRAVWDYPTLWNRLQMYDIYFDDKYIGKGMTATQNREDKNYYGVHIYVVEQNIIHDISCFINFQNSIIVTRTEFHETTKVDLPEKELENIDIQSYVTHTEMKLIGVRQTFRNIKEEDLEEQKKIYQSLSESDQMFLKKRESELNLRGYIGKLKNEQAKLQKPEAPMETIPDTMMQEEEYTYDNMTDEQKAIYKRLGDEGRKYFENLYNAPIIELIINGFVN